MYNTRGQNQVKKIYIQYGDSYPNVNFLISDFQFSNGSKHSIFFAWWHIHSFKVVSSLLPKLPISKKRCPPYLVIKWWLTKGQKTRSTNSTTKMETRRACASVQSCKIWVRDCDCDCCDCYGGRRKEEERKKNYDFKASLASHLRLWLGLDLS